MVTPDDVAVALGLPSPEGRQALQWQFWIDAALLAIRLRRADLSSLDADVLDYVITEAVAAQVKKPDDATQVDVSIDDGSVSRRYSSSTGRVSILDEWWDMLGLGQQDSGAFTISPSGAPEYGCRDSGAAVTRDGWDDWRRYP